MTLYEIRDQIARILDTGFVVDEETGEVLADESSLDALKMAEEEKLENIICYRQGGQSVTPGPVHSELYAYVRTR